MTDNKPKPPDIQTLANDLATVSDADIYLYNGPIERVHFTNFAKCIDQNRRRDTCLLILVTRGGDPDAGYKIARYVQENYKKFILLVPGFCKSAGTLIAVGAHCIAFGAHGELGPIDVQTYKTDNLAERQSGLAISEALDTLVTKAIQMHGSTFASILNDTDAIVSFHSAAKVASDLIVGLFAPVFARIDPTDVGEKARAMRIASEYGKRLAVRTTNVKNRAVEKLTRTYPAHSFVIDRDEAGDFFNETRKLSDAEAALIEALGAMALDEVEQTRKKPVIMCLSGSIGSGTADAATADAGGGKGSNIAATAGAAGKSAAPNAGKPGGASAPPDKVATKRKGPRKSARRIRQVPR